MAFLLLLMLGSLLAIAWQDFKHRAVYWWLFALLLLSMGGIKSIGLGIPLLLSDFLINCSFLALQFLLLTLYFSFKEKQWVNIFKERLGLGDLLFLLCLAAFLSCYNYIAFYLFSLVVVLLFTLISTFFWSRSYAKIPLAGEQALLLVIVFIVAYFEPSLSLTTDQWLIHHLLF